MKKLLSFALALVMIISLVPMTVSAEPYWGNFYTLEELLNFPAEKYEFSVLTYCGKGPLVFTGEMELYSQICVQATEIEIAEGAVVTLSGGELNAQRLVVNGVLKNKSSIMCHDTLTVNGRLENEGYLNIGNDEALTGFENIIQSGYGSITISKYISPDISAIEEELLRVQENATPGLNYWIHTEGDHGDGRTAVTMTADLCIPSNVTLHLHTIDFTIPEGLVLTVDGILSKESSSDRNLIVDGVLEINRNGNVSVCDDMTVVGKLINKGSLRISSVNGEMKSTGSLTLTENAVYEGKGSLTVERLESDEKLSDYLIGLDTSIFSQIIEESWGWRFYHEAGSTNNSAEFDSFESLKALIANHDGGNMSATYTGNEPLVIEGNLDIPDGFRIYCNSAPIVIAEGAEVFLGQGGIYFDDMTVNGTLKSYGHVRGGSGTLTVNGSIENHSAIELDYGIVITGFENIKNYANFCIMHMLDAAQADGLAEALKAAKADGRVIHTISVWGSSEGEQACVTLKENLVVPANVQMYFSMTDLVIPQGIALRVEGQTQIQTHDANRTANVTVDGTLEIAKYGRVMLYTKMTFGEKGALRGPGTLNIYGSEERNELSDCVTGLDLANYTLTLTDMNYVWLLNGKDDLPDWPTEDLPLMPEGEPDEVLDAIVGSDDYTAEQKLAIVQDIGTEELVNAMTSVDDRDNVVSQLIALEKELGGLAEVSVSDAPFEADKILVVGATLNNSNGGRIGLVIGQPETEHPIPEEYDDASAIRFSMDLKNASNSAELDVPVEIVMPLPEGFDPDGTVILHYHGDGVSTIYPAIDNLDNGYLVRFVITGFSDFIMTAPAKAEEHGYDYGDVNHDGDIKISDAILVMKYRAGNLSEGDTFCERCANVKGEGAINIQSAILIMKKRANKNMLFPVELQ